MNGRELSLAVFAIGVLLLIYPVRILREKSRPRPDRRRLALWKPLAILTVLVLILATIMFILPEWIWL
jgi:amino acid transporter